MKTYLECIPCFMQQAYNAANLATNNKEQIKNVLDNVGDMIKYIDMEKTPPEMGMLIYKKVKETTQQTDPYKAIKRANIEEAKSLYPTLKKIIKNSEDKLLSAIRIAIAGNIIDFGVNQSFNLRQTIEDTLIKDFAIFDYEQFKNRLIHSENILYIGDNAGESVFDKILIEELNKNVTYAVREVPIINDCIIQDAIDSEIDKVADIISSGSEAPATILSLCNKNFIHKFNNADMIISKGQGNYEGLSNSERSIFFLLKAKCKVIAYDLNVNQNDIILKGINPNK